MKQRSIYFRTQILLIIFCIFTMGCGISNLQKDWNAMTPDQQSSVILNGLQDQLTVWFDSGKTYVTSNPKYQEEWQTKVVPAFDLANRAIQAAIISKKDPSAIYSQVAPLVNAVVIDLQSWGVVAAKK